MLHRSIDERSAVPTPSLPVQLWNLLKFQLTGDKLKIIDELTRRHGPIVRVGRYFLLVGPDANQLLVASPPERVSTYPNQSFPTIASMDGAEHIRHRRVVMAGLRGNALLAQVPAALDAYARRTRAWGDEIDLYPEMKTLALDALLAMMLGIGPGTSEYQRFVAAYWPLIARADPPAWFPGRKRRVAKAKRDMWALLHALLERRKQAPGPDAFSTIVSAALGDGGAERLTDEALVRYGYMLMDFGQGDISIYLTYAIACAARRPRCRERLLAEALGTDPGALFELERKAPYTFAFLLEVERLYTPVSDIHRMAREDLVFRKFHIPAGSTIVSSIFHTHRLPSLFRDPAQFDPERFLPPRNEHQQHPLCVMGFGGGRHMCVATVLSRFIAALVVHRVLKDFRLEVAGRADLPEIDYRRVLQVPKQSVRMRVVRRNGARTASDTN